MSVQSRIAITLLAAAGILSLTRPPAARAQSQLNEKLKMEQILADEISKILEKFLGPGNSHVNVVLNLALEPLPAMEKSPAPETGNKPKEPKPKDRPAHDTRWLWKDISGRPLAILPGFSVAPEVSITESKPKNESAKESASPPPEQPPRQTQPGFVMTIKNIQVSVVLDQSVSEKYSKIVEVMVSEIAELDPARGDALHVYKLPLLPIWKRLLLSPSGVANAMLILTGLIVVALTLWLLVKGAVEVLRAFGLLPARKPVPQPIILPEPMMENKDPSNGHKKEEAPKKEAPAEAASDKAQANGKATAAPREILSFVGSGNIHLLAELLEECEPQEIACVIGLLDLKLAGEVLDRFKPDRRMHILWLLTWAKSLPPQELEQVKIKWRERVGNAYGGTESVGELLSMMEPVVQTAFLQQLDIKAPYLSDRVRKVLIGFEDIFGMRDSDLEQLAQSVPYKEWAAALADMDKSYAERLIAALPEASRIACQQWMALTTSHNGHAAQARANILAAARALQKQGRITLNKVSGQTVI